MFHYRTPKSIKAYNWFKLAGTLILICIFVMLLLREQRAAATALAVLPTASAPVVVPTATAQPLPTPLPPTPTVAVLTPSLPVEADEQTVLAEAPAVLVETPAVAPPQPPTLTAPQSGALVAGNVVTLEGTGMPGAEIEILDHGVVVSVTVVQPDGIWVLDCLCDSGARSLSVQNAGDPESASEAIAIQVAIAPMPVPDDLVCDAEDIPRGIDHGTVYVVAPCEYIGLIAARVGVKLADLLAVNPQVADPNRIDPGQILNLPPR